MSPVRFHQQTIAKTADARAKSIATVRQELTGVNAFPLLGDDGVHAEPWPAPSAPNAEPAITIAPLQPHRLGEAFEALRDAADAKGGFKVFLASLGEIVEHNVRTTWTKNYLAAGGITALISDGYKTPEAAAEAFRTSGASAACICSSDAINASLAEPTAKALKAAGATFVLMAGRPGENEKALKAAGVDQFLFAGADAVATLKDPARQAGLDKKSEGNAPHVESKPPIVRTAARRRILRLRRYRYVGLSRRVWTRRGIFLLGAICVGLAAVAFAQLADKSQALYYDIMKQSPWLPFAMTPVGFAALAYATARWFPAAAGSGIPQVIAARKSNDQDFRRRLLGWPTTVAKIVMTLLALVVGASVGREGPTVQIGASVMFAVAGFAGIGRHNGLVLAGSAAGIAAAFNAPHRRYSLRDRRSRQSLRRPYQRPRHRIGGDCWRRELAVAWQLCLFR